MTQQTESPATSTRFTPHNVDNVYQRAGNTDAKTRSRTGPELVTTLRPTTQIVISARAGPESVKKPAEPRASSGDHTQATGNQGSVATGKGFRPRGVNQ